MPRLDQNRQAPPLTCDSRLKAFRSYLSRTATLLGKNYKASGHAGMDVKMDRCEVEDDLPELSVLFGLPSNPSSIHPANLRRSPRKNPSMTVSAKPFLKTHKNDTANSKQLRRSPAKPPPEKNATNELSQGTRPKSDLTSIPLLPRAGSGYSTSATSNNRSFPKNQCKPTHLSHVDSLLLPLSRLAMQEESSKTRPQSRVGSMQTVLSPQKSMMSMMTEAARETKARKSPRKLKPPPPHTSRYVLKEARCNDDDGDSGIDEEEDEETDLSGFIVDDNAELSLHDSSGSEYEVKQQVKSRKQEYRPSRRLHRGSRHRSSTKSHVADLTNANDEISSTLQNMTLSDSRPSHAISSDLEVVDLTSPAKTSREASDSGSRMSDPFSHMTEKPKSSNLFDEFDRILRLSPPKLKPATSLPGKQQKPEDELLEKESEAGGNWPTVCSKPQYATPPTTPPRSPSKLKSPSKLLSPSKREANLRSPHRQSTDAFWDFHTINEWTDLNSPKKAPAASPRRTGLARFHIWSDDSEDDASGVSEDSLPSPCESPTKPKSPTKSPVKAEMRRVAEERKREKAKKAAFDASKRQLAQDLLDELDARITEGKLSKLAFSTGGVKINWSKTLRSTAGRANWRRTVTKNSGSPIKSNVSEGPGIKVEHFANIELAEKVIDCEERLVNTLAHEFCHLANFMISNIRDQPHGTSFKSWAAKVTKHLRLSENELWRKVEVTTKHNYAINHKYLWACVGRDKTKAMEFLNLNDDEGCGAEYGRHSRSIDPEKSRCGRCKGKLLQVRPKPRMSPVKKVEKIVEVVEICDSD